MDREEWRRVKYEARAERRAARQVYAPYRGALVGAVIIAVGVMLLLRNMDIIRFHNLWEYAPLIFVFGGAMKLIEAEGRPVGSVFGVVLAGVGGLWFASNMDWLRIDQRLIGPIIVMIFGAVFLIRAIERQRYIASAQEGPASVGSIGDHSVLHDWALFGGVKRNVTSQAFQGGELIAMFGGVEVDLRRAVLGREEVVIDANAMFGGIEIHVPPSWTVIVKGNGIFGGYEDKTLPPSNPQDKPQRLVVSGVAIFGGVVVQN
jgi:predicted membrane protein